MTQQCIWTYQLQLQIDGDAHKKNYKPEQKNKIKAQTEKPKGIHVQKNITRLQHNNTTPQNYLSGHKPNALDTLAISLQLQFL